MSFSFKNGFSRFSLHWENQQKAENIKHQIAFLRKEWGVYYLISTKCTHVQLGGREKNKIVFVWQKRLDVTFDVSIDNAHKNQISFLKKGTPNHNFISL